MTTQDKQRFRTTVAWKRFRSSLIESRGPRCQICGVKYSGARKKMLHLHHIDPSHYTDLDPEMFALLCSSCHEGLEAFIKSYFSPLYKGCADSKYRLLLLDLYYDFSIELQQGKRFY